jgi:DNA-binding transcriptional regulator GbsR (MarR family)
MNKPLILELDEAKKELVQCVNEIMQRHGLNCYLLEPIFAELYAQIKATAQNELAQARQMEMAKATTQND